MNSTEKQFSQPERKWWELRSVQFFGLTILFLGAFTWSVLVDRPVYVFSSMAFFCLGVFLAS